jgi:hypothetical protein
LKNNVAFFVGRVDAAPMDETSKNGNCKENDVSHTSPSEVSKAVAARIIPQILDSLGDGVDVTSSLEQAWQRSYGIAHRCLTQEAKGVQPKPGYHHETIQVGDLSIQHTVGGRLFIGRWDGRSWVWSREVEDWYGELRKLARAREGRLVMELAEWLAQTRSVSR